MSVKAAESPSEIEAHLAWFKDRHFHQLFDDQEIAKKALSHLGFDEPHRRTGIAAAIVVALFGIAFTAILFTVFVPKDGGRCYTIKVEFPISANITVPFGVAHGQMCPEKVIATDWVGRARTFVSPDLPAVFSNLSVLVAIIIAIYQWRVTRSHGAFSEAFARKVTSNQTLMKEDGLSKFISAAQADGLPNPESAKPDIFIYMEIDNLEYVFEKYRDNEISAKSALRQCFILVSRCGNSDFRNKAIEFSSRGFYRPEFSTAVKRIAHFANSPSSKQVLLGRMAASI